RAADRKWPDFRRSFFCDGGIAPPLYSGRPRACRGTGETRRNGRRECAAIHGIEASRGGVAVVERGVAAGQRGSESVCLFGVTRPSGASTNGRYFQPDTRPQIRAATRWRG